MTPESEDAKLLGKLGDQHEKQYLHSLLDAGKTVVSIERGPNAIQQTTEALMNGVDVVYQGALKGS